MTFSAWMIAQDMRRIERDAMHLAALREARAQARSGARRRGLRSLVAAARARIGGEPRPLVPDCCAA